MMCELSTQLCPAWLTHILGHTVEFVGKSSFRDGHASAKPASQRALIVSVTCKEFVRFELGDLVIPILHRPGWILHNTIDGQELGYDYFSHGDLLRLFRYQYPLYAKFYHYMLSSLAS